MAVPLNADALVAALKAEGVTVVEHDGWRTHNRNHKGAWGPVNGVIIHHTVTSGSAATVELCYDGYTALPGPLCPGVITTDGRDPLVGNGRANHAGGGDPAVLAAVAAENYGDTPPATHEHQGSAGAVDGNSRFYGFECENLGDGNDPWPAVQLEAMIRASAALCRAHGWTARSVIGHKEWSDWKSDPRGVTMAGFRAAVAERLGAKPEPSEPNRPEYQPFPGAAWFKKAPRSAIVTAMGKRLVAVGCSAYREGPGPQWTEADRSSYAKWQRKLGYTGTDADGWPGPTSWAALKVPYVKEV